MDFMLGAVICTWPATIVATEVLLLLYVTACPASAGSYHPIARAAMRSVSVSGS